MAACPSVVCLKQGDYDHHEGMPRLRKVYVGAWMGSVGRSAKRLEGILFYPPTAKYEIWLQSVHSARIAESEISEEQNHHGVVVHSSSTHESNQHSYPWRCVKIGTVLRRYAKPPSRSLTLAQIGMSAGEAPVEAPVEGFLLCRATRPEWAT